MKKNPYVISGDMLTALVNAFHLDELMSLGWVGDEANRTFTLVLKDNYSIAGSTLTELMQRGVSLIELMQHSEIIFKNANPEKKRKMVELVSSNLLLKDGTLEYHWRKPFDLLVISGQKEDWRSQRDSNSCILREREVS